MIRLTKYLCAFSLMVVNLGCEQGSESDPLQSTSHTDRFRVATFNVDYKNRNFWQVANHFNSVKSNGIPYIAASQENQSGGQIARSGHFQRVRLGKGSGDNSILFSGPNISLQDQGQHDIERDTHAERTLVWSKFKVGNRDVVVFNAHLPHGAVSNVAGNRPASAHSHKDAANILLAKWHEFGKPPTAVLCDCNTGKVGGQQFKDVLTKSGHFTLAEDGGLDLVFFSNGSLEKVDANKGGSLTENFHRIIWAELKIKSNGHEPIGGHKDPKIDDQNWHPTCTQYMKEGLIRYPRDSQEVQGMRWNKVPDSWEACVLSYQNHDSLVSQYFPWDYSCQPYMKDALRQASPFESDVEGMRWNTQPHSWRACVEGYIKYHKEDRYKAPKFHASDAQSGSPWNDSCEWYMINALSETQANSEEVQGMRWNNEPTSWQSCVEGFMNYHGVND